MLIIGVLLGVFMSPRDVVVKIGNSEVNDSVLIWKEDKKNSSAWFQILVSAM